MHPDDQYGLYATQLHNPLLLDSDYGAIVDQTQKTGDTPCSDVWEINLLNPMSKERLGYPTQKPLALYGE